MYSKPGYTENKTYYSLSKQFCNNCGKQGHVYNQCKVPITSIGIITFRINNNAELEYLMICRKHTLGFIDFMRGKYLPTNKEYILNMMKQMTDHEKRNLVALPFADLWKDIWGNESISVQYKMEENTSRDRFAALVAGVTTKTDHYTLTELIESSNTIDCWEVPEWGFPKGRRNYQEKDYICAMREFTEETGYPNTLLQKVNNILPFEEIFTGSNYKSYKHKYYLTYMDYQKSLRPNPENQYECYEISKLEWKTFEQCIESIRPYNLEKIRVLTNINTLLKTYKMVA